MKRHVVLRFVTCFLVGLAGHLFHYPISALETGANRRVWYRLARYGIGYILLGVALLINTPAERAVETLEAYSAGAIPVGAGVVAGYMLDWLSNAPK